MTSSWLDHLRSRDAVLEGEHVTGFGDPARIAREPQLTLDGTVLAPVTDRGALRATGPDATRFLQAQLTNDVSATTASTSQLSAYCSPKGRMIACLRLLREEAGFLLSAPRDVIGLIRDRLTYFRLRAQVDLDDVSDTIVHLGLAGAGMGAALRHAGLELPEAPEAVHTNGDTRVVRLPGERTRVEILSPRGAAQDLWNALATAPGVEPVGAPAWLLLDVREGIPWIFRATSEAFVPQMANLHALSAISFTKGCFPGQEIVARLRYRGLLKRRMYRLSGMGKMFPVPGEAVRVAGPAAGSAIRGGDASEASDREDAGAGAGAAGQVVMAAPAPGGGHELLAVLVVGVAERADAVLTLTSGGTLTREDLPYDVERAFDARLDVRKGHDSAPP